MTMSTTCHDQPQTTPPRPHDPHAPHAPHDPTTSRPPRPPLSSPPVAFTYFQICTGTSGHTEGIQIAYDPDAVAFEHLLSVFWDFIDPTQKDGQGHDWGTQCESQVSWTYCAYRDT